MGGHGGINILHEKKWHTYNTSNRIRVERDERNAREQAAAEARTERRSRLRRKVEGLRSASSSKRHDDGDSPISRGSNINLFSAEEKEWEAVVKDHNKHIRGQEINNQLAGKSKKRPMSEFDEMASLKPWYLQPRASTRSSHSSEGLEGEGALERGGKLSRDIGTISKVEESLGKSGHKRKHRPRTVSREELRAKRLERERLEHQRAENVKDNIR
ncbi:hypothetical protein FOZ61_010330 [Perkinsus olseni]|uniref:CBF1-interacting co-repressor CIR N-terminal domain-containing protein n=1 Tax=Perkinsus olseni TaxID=32597 RepID=A0A7J6KYE5_PEROL|nr:hypothetical protein FOZ61_010330 [Perkinsus olseni]